MNEQHETEESMWTLFHENDVFCTNDELLIIVVNIFLEIVKESNFPRTASGKKLPPGAVSIFGGTVKFI